MLDDWVISVIKQLQQKGQKFMVIAGEGCVE